MHIKMHISCRNRKQYEQRNCKTIHTQSIHRKGTVPIPPTDESAGFLGTFFIEISTISSVSINEAIYGNAVRRYYISSGFTIIMKTPATVQTAIPSAQLVSHYTKASYTTICFNLCSKIPRLRNTLFRYICFLYSAIPHRSEKPHGYRKQEIQYRHFQPAYNNHCSVLNSCSRYTQANFLFYHESVHSIPAFVDYLNCSPQKTDFSGQLYNHDIQPH